MFFIYTSFLEFVVMNYLARWVQDPEEQKKKKENAILDSLQLVTTTLDISHPNKPGTLGGQLHSLGGNLENKLKFVGGGRNPINRHPRVKDETEKPSENNSIDDITSDSNVTNATPSQSSEAERNDSKGRYTLTQVKKIDMYSRRIFPTIYGMFVLYFFIRYHAIEGAMSIGEDE